MFINLCLDSLYLVAYLLCRCNFRYNGRDCSTPVCNPPCDHGKCSEPDICTCDTGYTGKQCSQFSCEKMNYCSGELVT